MAKNEKMVAYSKFCDGEWCVYFNPNESEFHYKIVRGFSEKEWADFFVESLLERSGKVSAEVQAKFDRLGKISRKFYAEFKDYDWFTGHGISRSGETGEAIFYTYLKYKKYFKEIPDVYEGVEVRKKKIGNPIAQPATK